MRFAETTALSPRPSLTGRRRHARRRMTGHIFLVALGMVIVFGLSVVGHYIGQREQANATAQWFGVLSPASDISTKAGLLYSFRKQAFVVSDPAQFGRPQTVESRTKGDLALTMASVESGGPGDFQGGSFPQNRRVTPWSRRHMALLPLHDVHDDATQMILRSAPFKRTASGGQATAPAPAATYTGPAVDVLKAHWSAGKGVKRPVVPDRWTFRQPTSPRRCLAQAIYFEARSEPEIGQLAVARVILNRVKSPQYPNDICSVVYQGSQRRNACQFSFACDGYADTPASGRAWTNAQNLAERILVGKERTDTIFPATHYHADYVAPNWARSMTWVTTIGRHIFYQGT